MVTDIRSGESVPLANVYLSNTTVGASTSQTGYYFIKNIPEGVYQLIFQHVGYEIKIMNVQLEDNQSYVIDAQLQPRIYDSEEIEIFTTEPREWMEQLEFFIKQFIGETHNADDCEILNPEVLNFKVTQESRTFIAYTDSIVRIKNNSLGYRINLVLAEFLCKKDRLSRYRIYPRFELLEARNEEEAEQWVDNRQKTYFASLKHFLSTLARGKIKDENINLLWSDNISYLLSGYGNYIHGDSLKIVDTDKALYKKFYLDDYLKVTCLPEKMYPPSILKIEQEYIVIDTLGNILTPGSVRRIGKWFNQRVADTLPWEYLHTN